MTLKWCQTFALNFTSTVRLSNQPTVVLMDIAATVRPKVCPKLCSAEQCAFMCFTGLTADSDEGIDDAACHCGLVSRGREDNYSDLF